MTIKECIKQQSEILFDLGVTNREAIEAYFTTQTQALSSDFSKEMKIERLSKDILMNYYDGDMTFVSLPENKKEMRDPVMCYNKLKADHKGKKVLSESEIIASIKINGLRLLQKHNLIEAGDILNGKQFYTV